MKSPCQVIMYIQHTRMYVQLGNRGANVTTDEHWLTKLECTGGTHISASLRLFTADCHGCIAFVMSKAFIAIATSDYCHSLFHIIQPHVDRLLFRHDWPCKRMARSQRTEWRYISDDDLMLFKPATQCYARRRVFTVTPSKVQLHATWAHGTQCVYAPSSGNGLSDDVSDDESVVAVHWLRDYVVLKLCFGCWVSGLYACISLCVAPCTYTVAQRCIIYRCNTELDAAFIACRYSLQLLSWCEFCYCTSCLYWLFAYSLSWLQAGGMVPASCTFTVSLGCHAHHIAPIWNHWKFLQTISDVYCGVYMMCTDVLHMRGNGHTCVVAVFCWSYLCFLL